MNDCRPLVLALGVLGSGCTAIVDAGSYEFEGDGGRGPADAEADGGDAGDARVVDAARPDASDAAPDAGPDDDALWRHAVSCFELGASDLLGADSVEALLAARFPTDDIRVMRGRRARFHCDCSSERVSNALRMLGRAEIESILAEQGMVGVTCEFCNRSYSLVAADALALFAQASVGDPMAGAEGPTRK